jgi:HEPN domain-containing protein
MTSTLSAKQWFYVAFTDLAAAKLNAANTYPKLLDIACYHCHQAAEKALKGFLQYKDQTPPRIHNLEELCRLCIKQDPSFKPLYDTVTVLNPYNTASRYPRESLINEGMTQTAIAQAQAVYDFCLSKAPDLKPDMN